MEGVMPGAIVAVIGAQIGATVIGTAVITTVAGIAITGATIGAVTASVLYGAYQQKQARAAAAAAYNASFQDRAVVVRSAVAYRNIVYGRAMCSGPLVYACTDGAQKQYLWLVIALAGHEVAAIDDIWFNDASIGPLDGNGDVTQGMYINVSTGSQIESVTTDASGNATLQHSVASLNGVLIPNPNASSDGLGSIAVNGTANGNQLSVPGYPNQQVTVLYTWRDSRPLVRVRTFTGAAGQQACADLISASGGEWTASHVGNGVAYLAVRLTYDPAVFSAGVPNIKAVVRGKKVYDFRTGTTAYSNNPALCAVDYLRDPLGFGAALGEFDSAIAIASANNCDETVTVAGGSQARYACDGVLSTGSNRKDNLEAILATMAGAASFSGGLWRVRSGMYSTPVMDLSDDDLAGSITTQMRGSRRDLFNGVTGTFVSEGALWQPTDFAPFRNAGYVAADGGQEILTDVQFAMVTDSTRAQRLAKITLERARRAGTQQAPFKFKAYKVQPGDIVTRTSSRYGWSAKSFRVLQRSFSLDGGVNLLLREDDAGAYAWNSGEASVYNPASTNNLPNPFSVALLATTGIASGTAALLKLGDGTIISRIQISWAAITSQAVLSSGWVEIQYRASDGAWSDTVQVRPDLTTAWLQPVTDGAFYLVRGRAYNGVAYSDWAYWPLHQVVGKTEPPSPPTGLSLTQSLIFFTPATDIDLAGTRARSIAGNVANPSFSRGTDLLDGLATSSPISISKRLYGVQTIMLVSEDTSGNQSTVTYGALDFGQPDATNFVQTVDYQVQGFPVVADLGPLAPGAYGYAANQIASFARASAATYVDVNGVLQTSPANVPRYDYSTGSAALLIEAASTNIALFSEQFDAGVWIDNGTTTIANTDTAPDGALTMDTVVAANGPVTWKAQLIAVPPGAALPFGWFVKQGTAAQTRLAFFDSTYSTAVATLDIAWTAGVPSIGGATNVTGINVRQAAAGIYFVSGTINTGANAALQMMLYPDLTFTGKNVKVWGAQLGVSGSYIKTVNVAATRAADICAISTPQTGWLLSGGNLVANVDPSSNVYALADAYGEPDVYGTQYVALSWVSKPFLPAYGGGTLTLTSNIAGTAPLVEYRIDGSTLNDAYALPDVYAAADLYGASAAWQPWPGALDVGRMQGVQFRVSVGAGSQQGVVSVFRASLALPDVSQTYGSVAISSSGTRLAPAGGVPARNWVLVKTAQITPVVDGGGAIAGRVLDFSAQLGPNVQLVDITGAAVNGRATVLIGGLADG
jgi:hypothetical protein